ncbi:nicotinate-nucleotide adenylyltransferase [Pseudoduganella flava]|uniref:Probable nicotinate-nucleotide adenylyltransferase n=1 Tax=Pseudoduganella flava TaxID=871742 RepID=A0A562PW48_9BURK|nr:nicotinate-nucleotide adenylyltransferase [Pseudoduganella flava]TWI48390.1 nicotinate-nucleotide adenylyltransferase [Pseudoduganella flava]
MTACVLLLGGSFDPVHNGHLALGRAFVQLLGAAELRVIPAVPWQKSALVATAQQRADMAALAFADEPYRVVVDRQEIDRGRPTYTVETLRALRTQLGATVPLCFLMGADQLQRLDTWHAWRDLFTLAHLCVATRPGFTLDGPDVPRAVAAEFTARLAAPQRLCGQPAGLTCIAPDLAVDVSSTAIRTALENGIDAGSLIPAPVLDYIEQHKLYKKYN